jgi:hypothetical protein
MDLPFSKTYSSLDGHLGCLYSLVTMNYYVTTYAFFHRHMLSFLLNRNTLLGYIVTPCLTFLKR